MVYIGVVESEYVKQPEHIYDDWFYEEYGYALCGDGDIIHTMQHDGEQYGEKIGENGIVDVCLDLQDKYEISFIINGKEYGKAFDVKVLYHLNFRKCSHIPLILLYGLTAYSFLLDYANKTYI